MTASLAAAAAVLAAPVGVTAQTTLPPVVVEGTSIAVKPAPKQAAQPRQGSQGAATSSLTTPAPAVESDGSTPGADPGRLLSNQGTATTVITAEELLQQQIRTPVDALRSLPGVEVSRTGSFAGLSQVRIRGAEGNHTLVLIDGIEANNPADGEFDFSNLLAGDEIERIEVMRGPQSGLYGSGAIGGVINIVTRSGKGPLTLTSRAEYGSFNTKDAGVTLSGGNDRAWGLVGFGTRKTGGFNISQLGDETDHNVTSSSILKAGISPFSGFTLEGTLRQTNKRAARDEENFFFPGVLVEQTDAPSRFSSALWLGALEAKLALLDGAWTQSVRADRKAITNDDFSANPAFAPFTLFDRYRSDALTYRYTSTFRLDTPDMPAVRHFVTGMAETRQDGFILYTDDNQDHERKLRSFAGEVRGEYWRSLFLTGSIRHDDSSVFQDFTTWRATGSLKVPSTPVRLHASNGTGIKFPTLFEQFGRIPGFFTPNPNLKPEQARGWDAGIELTFFGGRAIVDATWFETDFTNKIRGINAGSTVANIPGMTMREGLELAGKVIPLPGLTIGVSYTFLETREPNGFREIRRPGSTARIDANYQFDRGRAKVGVAAIYNGSMIDEAFRTADPFIFPLSVERVLLNDYWLVQATASYRLTESLELYGRVENALNQSYQEIYGFQTAGTAAYAGLRMKLQDTRIGSSEPAPR
jgi:vitamin B12 transporter